METASAKPVDLTAKFEDFLWNFKDPKTKGYKYRERITHMALMNQRSLLIDFSDLALYSRDLARFTEQKPREAFEALSFSIKNLVYKVAPDYAESVEKFYPRVTGLTKILRVRDLNSEHIGKLVSIDGIVTRVTRVEVKLVQGVFRHNSPECMMEFEYPEKGEMGERFIRPPFCTRCGKTGRFDLVVEKSKFVDWQKIVVQEKPEETPPGQIPRSIEVILTGDLVDSTRPGDRVTVTGVLDVLVTSSAQKGVGKTVFSLYVDANHVEVQQKILEEVEITREDEEKIRELARDPWIRERIVASIAPSIYGHTNIKEAIALLLFGGVPKELPDGSRIRGDIHVLLVGDPGTAKSQLLQYTARIAPRGLYTSGKGSTAAGLTATVLRDKMTGEFYLEAGAMVLADGGVACIDEIDKMRDEDREAIHEALEQQTVSIAKAGIVARLNARASVLAAGNPRYGRYDIREPIGKNIDLPPTILSRFDLIFVIQDIPDKVRDRLLAKHILEIHTDVERTKPLIDHVMLRKFISYARRYIKPRLTEEAKKLIEEFYVKMRMSGLTSVEGGLPVIPITPRQLEALIRLTEAYAKMALKTKATVEDAEEAIRLMYYTLKRIGFDVETKSFDIDIIETGLPRSRTEKIKAFSKFLLEEVLASRGEVSREELYQLAQERKFEKEFVDEMIENLHKQGVIIFTTKGKIQKT